MLRPKPDIENLVPGKHGGIDYAELEKLGITPQKILDFSVSTNPFGPPPGIEEALKQAGIDRYPDSEAIELTGIVGLEKTGVSKSNLLIGSGSTELIRLIATAYFSTADTVIIPQPTYGEYEVASRIAGAQVIKQRVPEETGFQLNIAETIDLIKRHHPKGIFVCNPNNPTGQYLSKADIIKIISTSSDTLIVLDEAYIAFTEEPWISTDMIERNNVVILRSMTKDYALAGLRLGYLMASETIISALRKVKPPWSVSSVAQAAGIFVLKANGYLEECQKKIKEATGYMTKELKGLGFSPLPSQSNFFLIKVGDAANFRQALLREGILVRDCTSFGLPDYVRLAPRSMADCRRLIAAIKETGVC